MNRTLACLLAILLSPFCLPQAHARSVTTKPLVFTHVNVIAATGTPLQTNMTVVIAAGRLSRVGKFGKTRIPSGAKVIDATGRFLIPGLWDMHAHLGTEDFDRDGHLALFIVNGVTGIRIMDGDPAHHLWRREITSGTLIGPRMIIASPIIGQSPISVADARREVRNAKQLEADFIKVHDGLSREAYFAVIKEARTVKLPVEGHVPLAITAAEASEAGQRSIEHFTGLDEAKSDAKKASALAALFRKNHTWLCPTIIMRLSYASLDDETKSHDPRLEYVKPAWVRRWIRMSGNAGKTPESEWLARRSLVQKEKYLVGLMQREGVWILAGTDEISPFVAPGFSLHDELELLVEAGLTTMQALQTATLNPARFLNKATDMGTIEKGKLADLVLLDANPLVDIRNTKKINSVILNGRLFDRQSLDRMLSEIKAAGATGN
jgi:imidazolonepropionase-like amidohydrolase